MSNYKQPSQETIIDTFPYAYLLFAPDGSLIHMNHAAQSLLTIIDKTALIFSIDDLNTMLNIMPIDKPNMIDDREIKLNGMDISIVRRTLTEDDTFTIVSLINISNKKNQLKRIYKQTTDMLWKIRSRITPIHNAFGILTEYSDTIPINEKQELHKNSHFELFLLERLLDTFKYLSHINSDTLKDAVKPSDSYLKAIIEKTISHISSHHNLVAKENVNIDCQNEIKCSLCPSSLEYVFETILLNSSIYSSDQKKIEISTNFINNYFIEINICDNGIGISSDDESSIFSYGFRGKNADDTRYQGLGCELFVSRKLVQEMRGRISFTSREGIGTTFTITLPRNT